MDNSPLESHRTLSRKHLPTREYKPKSVDNLWITLWKSQRRRPGEDAAARVGDYATGRGSRGRSGRILTDRPTNHQPIGQGHAADPDPIPRQRLQPSELYVFVSTCSHLDETATTIRSAEPITRHRIPVRPLTIDQQIFTPGVVEGERQRGIGRGEADE